MKTPRALVSELTGHLHAGVSMHRLNGSAKFFIFVPTFCTISVRRVGEDNSNAKKYLQVIQWH